MSDLPKYAQELKNRMSRSGPLNFTPVQLNDDYDVYYDNQYDQNSEELDKLHEIIEDLQSQFDKLQANDTQTEDLQNQIEQERKQSSELLQRLEESQAKLKTVKETADQQEDQIHYYQSILVSKTEQANSKENMLYRLHDEYEILLKDYKRALSNSKSKTIQIRQAKEDIDSLQIELNSYQADNTFNSFQADFNTSYTQNTFDDIQIYEPHNSPLPFSQTLSTTRNVSNSPAHSQSSFSQAPSPIRNVPSAMVDSFELSQSQTPSPKRVDATSRVPSAMRDSFALSFSDSTNDDSGNYNVTGQGVGLPPRGPFSPVRSGTPRAMEDSISFGDDSRMDKSRSINTEMMNISDLRYELSKLQNEKEDIEKICNRSPPKGMSISRAKRIREDNEDKLDEIEHKMGQIRLKLRQLNNQ